MLFKEIKLLQSINNLFRLHKIASKAPIIRTGNKYYVTLSQSQVQEEKPPDSAGQPERIIRHGPGKVRLGLIPDEWFQFFYKKTGVSGFYVFLVTVPSFLFSKELYVMEHEYYSGLSVLLLLFLTAKTIGSQVGKAIDKSIDGYEYEWNSSRINKRNALYDMMQNEHKLQESMDGQLMLQDAKKENVHLQLEEEYRKRLVIAHITVKRRLDFQVVVAGTENKFIHRNMIEWVVDKVLASYTDEEDKKTIDNCMIHLSALSEKYKVAA